MPDEPKVPMTWPSREQPILEALFALEEAGEDRVWSGLIAEKTGIPEAEVARGMSSLLEAGYCRVGTVIGGYGRTVWTIPSLREKGRRAIGQWPADSFDAFVAALNERMADEPDPEVKSKLKRLLEAATTMGRDVLTDVIAATIKHAGGI